MNATEPAINCAHCITQDGITKYNCNPSGIPGDERCVCGPRSQDWTSNCWGTQQNMSAIMKGPLAASEQTCTKTAAGQNSVYIPGAEGHGCGAPYNDANCCFCVYDMAACEAAYGSA